MTRGKTRAMEFGYARGAADALDVLLTRRDALRLSGAALLSVAFAGAFARTPAHAAHHGDANPLHAAKQRSALVYISPLHADGRESRCQAEVWFVTQGDDVLVVTPAKSWRAVSATREDARARLWVGNHGVWTTSDGAYRRAPRFDAHARVDTDPKAQAYALAAFGQKYAATGWERWGPRFRKGLKDGTRALLRYTPVE